MPQQEAETGVAVEGAGKLPRTFLLGYNTCGYTNTRDVVQILRTIRTIGYQGVELTLDKIHYHPYHHDKAAFDEVKAVLKETGLANVLATGARYVLSDVKHEPSVVSAEVERRQYWKKFLHESIEMADDLESDCVMLHSGYLPKGVNRDEAWKWMVEQLKDLCQVARRYDQKLAMEFHPEMFLRTYDDYRRLKTDVGEDNFGLTLDVGHCACTEPNTLAIIQEAHSEMYNVHLDDIEGRVHKHLPLGQGSIDFKAIFKALDKVGYRGLASVELNSGDMDVSDDELAAQSYGYLVDRVSPGPFVMRSRSGQKLDVGERRRGLT